MNMEDIIEEKLNDIYKFNVKIKFRDFRKYEVYFNIHLKNEILFVNTYFTVDVKSDLDNTIQQICEKINKEIVKVFIKKEKRENENKI